MKHSGAAHRSWILLLWLSMLGLALALSACGGSGGEGPEPPGPNPPAIVNLPPTANAGLDQLVLTGASVSLAGAGTDPDGSISAYAWTQTAGANVTLTGGNSANASFTAPAAAGDLAFQLSVTDNAGATHTDTLTINVNASPVANAGTDQSVSAGANVTLSGGANDANGTIASYAWTQLSGSAVTLSSASVAAPTFIAPNSATTLEFRLTATDNHGATHFDNVTINVTALLGPVIVRQPAANTIAHEHGAALLFVVARGENLNYEWRHNGVVVGEPEAILMRGGTGGGLSMFSDGDCFTVVVSNAAGSVTSEDACLTVIEKEGDLDPYDDQLGDDYDWASGYASSLMGIAQSAAGRLTGPVGANSSGVPHTLARPYSCYSGQFIGATLDGHPVTAGTFLPLGQHTISLHWNECFDDADAGLPRVGAVLITYNFPEVFGVGTYTMHFSGLGFGYGVFNGSLDVTTTRTSGANGNVDETLVTLRADFCAGAYRETQHLLRSLNVERRFNSAGDYINNAYVDFDISLNAYDEEGYAGRMYQDTGSSILHLQEQPSSGDNNDPTHTASGQYVVGIAVGLPITEYFTLATFRPVGGTAGWEFEPVYPDDED